MKNNKEKYFTHYSGELTDNQDTQFGSKFGLPFYINNERWYEKHIINIIKKKGAIMLKKTVLKIAVTALTLAASLQAIPTNISGEMWNRYTINRTNGTITSNYFSFERGYLRFEPIFTDKIKGRFNVDIFSSDKYNDGAGLKLKYAYMEFAQLIPIKESKVTVGLDKTYFGIIYDWEYPVIDKALEDKQGVVSSADYGVTFSGYIPKGYGEYAIALYNGEGYTKTQSKVNKNFAPVFNLRVSPIAGVTIGGSLLLDKPGFLGLISKTSSGSGNTLRAESTWKNVFDKRMVYAGVTKLAFGPVEIWGEYLSNQYDSTTHKTITYADTLAQDSALDTKYTYKSAGYSITPIISLKSLISFDGELVGRYDFWDSNTQVKSYANPTMTIGLNYNILRDASYAPSLTLQANWSRKTYKKEDATLADKKPEDTYGFQLKWKFSSSILN